ncbi:MAG TPA: DUF2845 domain-containing protein [Woeseiaceae bacterium]|nr:DUF2845 domain-containing protein [Woeseiaceae bacterium]
MPPLQGLTRRATLWMMRVTGRNSLRATGRFDRAAAALCILLGLALAPEAHAMRCGNKLVSEGMHITKVLDLCGEPDHEQKRTVLRRNVFIGKTTQAPDSNVIRRHIYGWGTPPWVEVEIRELTWNFGPNKFMRRVRFEDGIVTEIETLERGYVE